MPNAFNRSSALSDFVAKGVLTRLLPQRPETLAEIRGQQRGLFPRREVSALVVPLVIEEVWIRACCPSLRRCVDLVGKDGDGYRNLDAPDAEEAAGRWRLT